MLRFEPVRRFEVRDKVKRRRREQQRAAEPLRFAVNSRDRSAVERVETLGRFVAFARDSQVLIMRASSGDRGSRTQMMAGVRGSDRRYAL